ncbi:MAG: primase protein [Parcubacteria group bacterium GW2011_GWA1_60_11]|uniref:DNA primase n=1 Tax=Candidatus Liptonbacteria bacterium RIFCSPLOWO2_12_FULL_60_15 TaxID=1798653 RepID=A0A1G2CNQ4_9BACT|nr:MAG: primase protein [Parcubacteria group bacterium GW2011_GWA1_60_11]OGZ02842.1 MAG: DNA primase [Candidatus Liptonbacteria bacterium RIFCSPLOWO2_12_FULL_60_15]
MTDPVREIKERINVVDFLRSYLQLLPAGRNFKALCPFHKEKTPSFMVSPDRQSWHCFGCGEGGDVFTFLMKYENLEFYEALRVLAEKAGVELRSIARTGEREFNVLFDANAAAAEYFKAMLGKTPAVLEYLKKRGLKQETIEEFGLGFAPDQHEGLLLWLRGKSIRPEDSVRAGLAGRNERGLYFDRFRGRVMFPIANHTGRVVGFTGRILPEYERPDLGKYVNSPETPIFVKSRILYGFYRTKGDIRNANAALLVEGQMDFLMVWQDGVKNVAATSGTALTPEHLSTLRRFADRLIVSFDTDEAGWAAGERAIDLAQALDFSVRVVTVPGAKDPADYVAAHPGSFEGLVLSARHAMEFYFERYGFKEGNALSLEEKKKAARGVLGKARNIASPIEKMHWIKKLAEISGVSEQALLEEMERLPAGPPAVQTGRQDLPESGAERGSQEASGPAPQTLTRRELIAERLLGLALSENSLPALKEAEPYLPPLYREAYRELVRGRPDESNASPRVQELAGLIQLRAGLEMGEHSTELMRQLKKEYLKDRQHELSLKIAEAERAGNDGRRDQLMQELASVAKEMHTI